MKSLLLTCLTSMMVYLGSAFDVPMNWVETEYNPEKVVLDFSFAIKQENPDLVYDELHIKSLPGSSEYGKWMTYNELNSALESPIANNAVHSWLNENGVYDVVERGDIIDVRSTAALVESLFGEKVIQYYNKETGEYVYVIPTDVLEIPEDVSQYIDFVGGLQGFPKNRVTQSSVQENGFGYITPYGLRQLYNVSVGPDFENKTSQAIAEFTGMTCITNSDLAMYLNASELSDCVMTESDVIGEPCNFNTTYPGTESSLDIQYQMAFQNSPKEYYINVGDWLFEMTVELGGLSDEDLPKVVSMSYGWNEAQQCDPSVFGQCYWNAPPEEYTRRVCYEFAKLSLRGVTFVASSGDSGPSGRSNLGCSLPDPFKPVFPTDCPYVLSVGGTMFENATYANHNHMDIPRFCSKYDCIVGGDETICNFDACMWTSGGGFSNYFEMGWWQYDAIQEYLNGDTVKPNHTFFNSEGRAYPDLVVSGHSYATWIDGQLTPVDGTSASGPTVSAMIGVLNNLRASQGRGTVGLVAPLLYNCTDCFRDLTVGFSNSTEGGDCSYGYSAGVGFDPVYGLGSPDFGRLYEYIRDLPQ